MRVVVYASLIITALLVLDTRHGAKASPWCSTYGAVSCGYDTFDQCMTAIRGVGGSCIRNTMEPAAQPAPAVVDQSAPPKRTEKKKPQKKPVASVAPQT